jgi:hypothetical protein
LGASKTKLAKATAIAAVLGGAAGINAAVDKKDAQKDKNPDVRGFLQEANREASTALANAVSNQAEPWDGSDPTTRQQEAMKTIAEQSGIGNLYAGPTPPEIAARERYMQASSDFMREGASRIPEKSPPSALPETPLQPAGGGGLRGWQNPATQAAAQAARRAKGM